MAKLTAFIALFAIALLIADTYAYRTTITTVEINDDNQGHKEKCREKGGSQQLRSCERYLSQRGRGVLLLREIDENPEQQIDECCRELRQVDEQCRCDRLDEIVREQQQQQRGQEGTQQLREKARKLPAMCGLRPKQCDF